MNQAYLLDAGLTPAFDFPPAVRPAQATVAGWVKTYQKTGASPLPTLNRVNGDGNEYREARFALRSGVSVGIYPTSQCRGIRENKGELMSLYEAVRLGLAWEVSLE